MRKSLALPAVMALIVGCSASGAPGPVRDRSVITADEVAKTQNANNAYELIQLLRPQWLKVRGAITIGGGSLSGGGGGGGGAASRSETAPDMPAVYVDRRKPSDAGDQALRDVDISRIKEIRFFEPAQAETLYGAGHLRGVIEITTKL